MKKLNKNCPNCGAVLGSADANGRIQCEYCDSEFFAPQKTPLRIPAPNPPRHQSKGFFLLFLIPVFVIMMISVTVFFIIQKQHARFDEHWNDVSSLNTSAWTGSTVSEQMTQIEIEMYNTVYETYSGTEYGSTVGYLLEKVVTNNKTNPEHLLTVRCGELCTTEEDEITQFKHTLDRFERYEVSLEYDTAGLVYEIEIQALPEQ